MTSPRKLFSLQTGELRPTAYAASTSRLTAATAARLSLNTTLTGHDGCVNRLAWDSEGQFLASVSDDRCLIVRPLAACLGGEGEDEDGEDGRPPTSSIRLVTRHTANIFGVAFLPSPSSSRPLQAVTGAMDGTVQLHDLGGSWGAAPSAPAATSSPLASLRRRRGGGGGAGASPIHTLTGATTTVFPCHTGRVKQVAAAPGEPHLFFSASEDGTARLFDTRDPALLPQGRGPGGQRRSADAPNVFAAPAHHLPLKALSICPTRPWLVAFACGDPALRVWDRRVSGPVSAPSARARRPLLSMAPPHLLSLRAAATVADLDDETHATFVDWSPTGLDLLGHYNCGEGVWRFECGGSGVLLDGGGEGGGSGASGGSPPPPPAASYRGALNHQTDIKEARFFGGTVVAGSDDGLALLWPLTVPPHPPPQPPSDDTATSTTAARRPGGVPLCVALEADADICNCVLPHPFLPLLATSGLESVVRIWGLGGGEEGTAEGEPHRRGTITSPRELATILSANAGLSAGTRGLGGGRGAAPGAQRPPPGQGAMAVELLAALQANPALLARVQRAMAAGAAGAGAAGDGGREGVGGSGGEEDGDEDGEGGPQCRVA